MPVIRVEPLGADITIADGETILAGAKDAGYRWPSVCGGEGTCRTCYVVVVSGASSFSSPKADESEALGLLAAVVSDPDAVRLACQARVHGDAVVSKRGVRPIGAN